MNEQNREEIMWKYLDGMCTEAEAKAIDIKVKEDPIFAQELNHLRMIDISIEQSVLQTAPAHLTSSILANLNQQSKPEMATFKFVPFMVIILILLSITVYLMPESTMPQTSLLPFDLSILEVNLNLSQKYLPYIFGSFAAVFLVWIDMLYSRRAAV